MAAVFCLTAWAGFAFAQSGDAESPVTKTWVMKPTLTGHTLPLYQLKDKFVARGYREAEDVKLPEWLKNPPAETEKDKNFKDSVLQTHAGPLVGVTQGMSFDGIGQGLTGPNGTYSVGSVPPDTDMAVGTTQVVSIGNTGFVVYNKSTGAVTAGPYNTNILWSALGTTAACDADDDGDAVAKFDQLAQRWIITQFAVTAGGTTGPFADCVAVSTTADATGSYTVLQFNPVVNNGKNFPDYPKIGVWPNVYSMTFDMFNAAGTSYVGGGICGIDRNALLAGNNPTIVCAQLASTDYALLPVDLDGSTYPPAANTSALYIENSDATSTSTVLYAYKAAYNFTAGTVTVSARQTITVSQYSNKTCTNTQKCVPQPTHTGTVASGEVFASESKLDTLAAHEMYRATYRNFGTYESVTVSGSVLPSSSGGTGSNTAIRWYEIRNPFGTPTVYQQSTYSPDTSLYRWMGSLAQDHVGNMALGYSGSSSTVFPSVYATGRLNTDTLNTMQGETQLFAGLNSQVNVTISGSSYAYAYRWGDYTAMMIDPNDCTFWYTGEYEAQAGEFNWSTRVLSFAFPSCTSTAALTMPIPGSTLTGASASFLWSQGTGSPTYHLDIGSTQGGTNYYSADQGTATQVAVSTLPVDGSTVYARMTQNVGGTPSYTDYTYTSINNGPAFLTAPALNATLTGASSRFTWTGSMTATAYWLDVGSSAGGSQYYQSNSVPTTTLSETVSGLPIDGSTVYATLYSYISGSWVSKAYTFTAYNNASNLAVITSPTPSSTLAGTSATFTWSAGSSASNYWIDIGSSAGGSQYFQSGSLASTVLSQSVSNLPTDGSAVYVTLYTKISGTFYSNAYTYTAFNAAAAAGTLTTPTPGSTLASGTVTFNWTAGSGATAYWLDAGSNPGGSQYSQSGNLGNVLTTTVTGIPTDGSTVYVTLYSYVGSSWIANAYTYTALAASSGLATMQTPTPGSTLSGSTVTFTWSADPNASAYWVDISDVGPGQNDVYQSGNLGNVLTTTVSNIPTDGSTIYVTLYSYVGGQWLYTSSTYVSGPGSNSAGRRKLTSPVVRGRK